MRELLEGEIYLITSPSGKYYVGQARCFIRHRGKFINHGTRKRWKDHVSEAYSNKKKQCWALNNAIKKYGRNNFDVRVLIRCNIFDLDYYESMFVKSYNSIFPHGYNLTSGGSSTLLNKESRKSISNSLKVYYSDPKNRKKQSDTQKAIEHRSDYTRKNMPDINQIPENLPKYMYYFKRKDGRQGFSVKPYKSGKRKYFSSKKMTMLERYQAALDFLNNEHLMGNPQPSFFNKKKVQRLDGNRSNLN